MKLPVSQFSPQDLAELFEKSSLKDQYFFPRKVPSLAPLELKKDKNKKQQSDQNEKSVENH